MTYKKMTEIVTRHIIYFDNLKTLVLPNMTVEFDYDEKFSIGHQHPTFVLETSVRIISIRKSKREGLMALKSKSKITNVRRR